MSVVAAIVVVAFGLLLIAFTGVVFVKPAIAVSSVALMCLPWQRHHRFGERVRPVLFRHLRLYAAGTFVFGALLLYAVFAGGGTA